jgi:hypothetical protein
VTSRFGAVPPSNIVAANASCTATPPFMSVAPRPYRTPSPGTPDSQLDGTVPRDSLGQGQRNGIQVSCKDDAFRVAQLGPGNDGVPVPHDVQFRDGAQPRLNGVGELRFVAGHTVDVHDRGGQERNVLAEVK